MAGMSGSRRVGAVPGPVETETVVKWLVDVLALHLVSSLAGVKDLAEVRGWASGRLAPEGPVEQRLRFAYSLLHRIEEARGRTAAQSWIMTINPRLGYGSPLKAIREGRFQAAAAAAMALLDGGYDG